MHPVPSAVMAAAENPNDPRPVTSVTPWQSATVVALMTATQMLNYFDRSVVGLASEQIMRDLHLTPRGYGMLSSAFFSLYAVSGIAVGLLFAHRVRPRMLIIAMITLWTLCQVPTLIAPSLLVLVLSRAALGAAESPSVSVCVAGTQEWYPPAKRSLPTAIVMAGPVLGSILAAPILTPIIYAFGWRAGFAVCALAGLCLLVPVVLLRRAAPYAGNPVSGGTTAERPPARFWLDPGILSVAAMGFGAYWVSAFAVSWLFPLLRMGLGFDVRTSGLLTSVTFAACAVAMVTLSWIGQSLLKRRKSERAALVYSAIAFLTIAGVMMVLPLLVASPRLQIACLVTGIALTVAVNGVVPVLIAWMTPDRYRNPALVVVMSCTSLSGMIAPTVVGLLITSDPSSYFLGAATYSVAALAAALFGWIGIHPDAARQRLHRLTGTPARTPVMPNGLG